MGVLVVVRIFSGGGWLVSSVIGGDSFFYLFWVILVVNSVTLSLSLSLSKLGIRNGVVLVCLTPVVTDL